MPEEYRGINLNESIFPLYLFGKENGVITDIKEYLGTGFYIPSVGIITCNHCINLKPEQQDKNKYAIGIPFQNPETLVREKVICLSDPLLFEEIDTAVYYGITLPNVSHPLSVPSEECVMLGTHIWTVGFPGSDQLNLVQRTFQGYIQRHYKRNNDQYIEVNLHVPAGLSGSPIIEYGTNRVLGILQGAVDMGITEEFASIDESGKKTPEILKIYTYGVAIDIFSLLSRLN